jgi:hypothetical protein
MWVEAAHLTSGKGFFDFGLRRASAICFWTSRSKGTAFWQIEQ